MRVQPLLKFYSMVVKLQLKLCVSKYNNRLVDCWKFLLFSRKQTHTRPHIENNPVPHFQGGGGK